MRRLPVLSSLLLITGLFASTAAHAQDVATFYKTQSISVWAAYVSTNTDRSTQHNNGAAIGLDYNIHPRFVVQPSVEVRATLTDGPIENFKSYDGGVKLATRPLLRRYRPYADLLAGFGTVHYVNCYGGNPGVTFGPGLGPGCSIRGDNSPVYSPGGGVDVDVTTSLRAKVDVQYELWNFGHSITIHPVNISLGVVYILPFAPHIHHREGRQ